MMMLHYAGETLLLAEGVGEAVLRYARALGEHGSADVVVVPFVQPDGTVGQARLLLGPASQLFSTPAADSRALAEDPAVIADLDERARRLRPSTPVPSEQVVARWLCDEMD